MLTAIVPADRIHRAYAIDAVTYDVGGILGPAIAGAAIAIGDRAPLATMAILTLPALPIVLRTPWPQPPRGPALF